MSKNRFRFFRFVFSILWLLALLPMLTGCQALFYSPSDRVFFTPEMFGTHYENARFQTEDGVPLHAWFVPALTKNAKGTVLFFHGNAHNISHYYLLVQGFPEVGYNLLTFDYRGYGLSGGEPNPAGLEADARAALRYLRSREDVDSERIIVYGQSLGGAAALHWLGAEKPSGIVAAVSESAFASYRKIAQDKLNRVGILRWFRKALSNWLLSDDFSPEAVIKNIAPMPLLIIHGTADPVVPYDHGLQLFASAQEPKTLWSIPNGGHIQMLGKYRQRYWPQLLNFLDITLKKTSPDSNKPVQSQTRKVLKRTRTALQYAQGYTAYQVSNGK